MIRGIRRLKIALTGTAILVLTSLFAGRPALTAGGGQATRPTNDRSTFVGTYRLVSTEVKDAKGSWGRNPTFNSYGYITYGETGHMAVFFVARNRVRFAVNTPTGEEAQRALREFTAYYGAFTVDEPGKFVVHHRAGYVNPGGPPDFKRFYEFDGDRLILTPPPADGGTKDKATSRLIWERLPTPPLSDEAKKFVGFYKLLYTDSYREKDGKEVFHGDRNYARAGSYILYTPSGHMMAHLMDREGRTKYAGAQPTPDEALKAYRSYTGYFGRFTTFENYNPRFVLHNQQGTTSPNREVDATKRFYAFNGNVLRLGAPPTVNAQGETSGGHLYWERLTAVK